MTRGRQRWFRSGFVIVAVAVAGWLAASPVLAGGQVGSGNPGSCSEAALNARLVGGGVVTFSCGGAPHTISLSAYKQINDDTDIRGGGLITLSGGDTTPLFQVFVGHRLILRDITLTRGSGLFGAIQNFGQLHLINSRLTNNNASVSGGAIENDGGQLYITNTVIARNTAAGPGGAIYIDNGMLTLSTSQVYSNTAAQDGGAIYNGLGSQAVISGGQIYSNTASLSGGGIVNSGALTLTGVTLFNNRAQLFGGGIYNKGALTLTGVTMSNNTATLGYGGGLSTEDAQVNLTNATIAGNAAKRGGGGIINLGSGAVSLTNVTLSGNTADLGAGIYNASTIITLTHVTLSGNIAESYGGGILNLDVANLMYTTLSSNRAITDGGALYSGGGILNLTNVALSGNRAMTGNGGGIYNDINAATLTNVTLNGNTAKLNGGGFYQHQGTANLTNVTLSGNTATSGHGGGFYNETGTPNLTHATLSGNSATSGGGIYNTPGYTVTLKNSIVADSPSGGNCGGGLLTSNHSDKYSLSNDNTCALTLANGSKNNLNAQLDVLADYGGPHVGAGGGQPMLTHRPLKGSPAIDGVIGPDFAPADQRGVARPIGAGADIGSVEYGAPMDFPTIYLPIVLR